MTSGWVDSRRETPPRFKLWSLPSLIIPVLLLVVSLYYALPTVQRCSLEAAHHQPGDYCYRMKVTVSNTNSTPLSNYPVRLAIPSSDFKAQGFIDANGWDIRGYTVSLNPVATDAQDLSATTAGWWMAISASSGSSSTPGSFSGWLYLGNPYIARDQGVNLAGADVMSVPDDNLLEWTDDFDIVVRAKVASDKMTQTNAGWVDKYEPVSNTGYYFGFDNGTVVAKVGDGATTDTISGAWDGAEANFRMRFDSGGANKLEIFKYNTATSTWDSLATGGTISAVSHNANDFLMGQGFTGILREIKTYKDVGLPGYAKVQEYGFNPVDMAETSASDPNYSGTIANMIGSSHDATYAWVRSQSGITYSLGPVMPISASPAETIPESLADVFNNPSSNNLFAQGTTNVNMPFYGVLETARVDMGIGGDAFWTLFFGGLFGIIGVAVLVATNRPEIAAIAPGTGLLIGAFNGLLAPWITVLYAMSAISIWLIGRWGQE